MNIADVIKNTREKLGMSQAQCAKILGVSPRRLWSWENGKKPTKIESIGIIHILKSEEAQND